LQYRLAARTYILDRFKEGSITREQAHEMTSIIKHPGDRADANALIEDYLDFKEHGSKVMGFVSYMFLWI